MALVNAPVRAAGGLGKLVAAAAAAAGLGLLPGRLSKTVRPQRDPHQAWFWTPEWQRKEAEARADIAAGKVESFDSDEALLAAFAPEADR
jgi:hypothetical protein